MEGASPPSHQEKKGEEICGGCGRGSPSASGSSSAPTAPASRVSSVLSIGIGTYSSGDEEARPDADACGWHEEAGSDADWPKVWPNVGASAAEAALFAETASRHLKSRVYEAPVRDETRSRPQGHASGQQVWRAVDCWRRNMEDGTTHMFFYAGHGCLFDGDFALVPSDSERPEDCIKLSTIRQKIDERRKNCNVLFFIAGCRNQSQEKLEKERRPRFVHDCDVHNDRYDKANLRQNFYLEFFACRPDETVEDAGWGNCGPFVRSLTQNLVDPSLKVIDVVDNVRAAVVKATANKEQPCVGFSSMDNFHLYEQSVVASEYSHGLAGPCSSPAAVIATTLPSDGHASDGHGQWRVRINRLTVQSNIEKPCILLLTDTGGDTVTKAFSHFKETGMGPHYIIHLDGRILQLVKEHRAAWCGNPAFWGTLQDRAKIPAGGFVNEVHYFAVSVALEGDGRSKEFSEVQYGSLVGLLHEVKQRYGIQPWDVLGLSEVCMPPGKSRAPGRHFDWGKLADAGLTYGPPLKDLVPAGTDSESELRRLMEEWGYCLGDSDGFAHRLQSFCDCYQSLGSGYSQRSFAVWALRKLLCLKARATAQQ